MTKIKIQRLVFLLVLSIMLSACSDDGNVSAADSIKIQENFDAKPASQDVIAKSSDEVDIQELMQQVAEAERQADEYGYVWTTTDGLIKKAYAEAKEGNKSEAKALFQEAISQFNLSIEQAKYANEHWTLLIPVND